MTYSNKAVFNQEFSNDEILKSAIKFRKTLKDYILFKLIEYFRENGINADPNTRVAKLFPRKGRIPKWRKFQADFPLHVPYLPISIISTIIVLGIPLLLLFFLFSWLIDNPEVFLITFDLPNKMLLFPILMLPSAIMISLFGTYYLRWKTLDQLAEGILEKNWSILLALPRNFIELLDKERNQGKAYS